MTKKCKYHCDYGDGENCHYKGKGDCMFNRGTRSMPDREKVIKEYEDFVNRYISVSVNDDYVLEMHKAVLALLKEQEAIEPHYNARTNWYECGACHYSMTSGMHCKSELIPAYKVGFCAKCGQAVKWE